MVMSAIPPLNYGRSSNRPYGRVCSHDRPNLGNMSAAAAASAVELAEKEKEQRTKGEVKKSLAVHPSVCRRRLPLPPLPLPHVPEHDVEGYVCVSTTRSISRTSKVCITDSTVKRFQSSKITRNVTFDLITIEDMLKALSQC